ncbi:MAG: 16S rRNA (uracil(1498)-N(3))-methyltransferase [Deltaproteobacteria bacterium]|nr:16S rRNA (uracil(1498)-N(3))-methyltransferase [Deltaproteobacteria bacterium]MBK7064350.1 16S rRNA (uracil(1498)-N(3))-methyltransferase [Deltaproteobacteria bacterium]MBK8697847.1 16S rRNA (uracil(1498)-N(3))-methyltransferase [Deltaproteobacteria bacterium]MBP6829245.1 16S rRNA (uracil(1498)-N(3))-methyltransferase [Deltaproteobacteria bacterium]
MSERVRVEPSALSGSATALSVDGDRGHHLVRVTRVRVGDRVVAFDGAGRERPAEVSRVGRGEVLLSWTGPAATGVGADRARVRWIQGLPKGDKMDLIVRQATELGVASIAPVFTARSIPREQPERWALRLQRWERIAEEASRQCGRADVPSIEAPQPLAALCAAPAGRVVRLTAWEGATASLRAAIEASAEGLPFEVLAGPEGGFEAAEVEAAAAAGFAPVSLGPRILRAETTAAAFLSALSVLRGDLGGSRAMMR